MKKKNTIHCSYSEIEALVYKHIKPEGWVGKSEYSEFYSLPCDLEANNDTSYEITVTDQFDDEDDSERIKEYCNGYISGYGYPHTYMTQSFMVRLCQLGFLEPGEYVINISW